MSSVEIKSVDARAVRAAMDDYAQRLLDTREEIEEIVVFGSFATGTWAPGSDLDVLIVLRDCADAVRDRIPRLLPGRFPVPVDLSLHAGRADGTRRFTGCDRRSPEHVAVLSIGHTVGNPF